MEEQSIKQCTSLWDQLSCAVVGIGASRVDVPEGLRVPSPSAPNTAAVCGWFFDDDGHVVEGRSTTSIGIKQLHETPVVLAVAGGRHKAAAILSVLRAGFVTHLATDEVSARAILHMSKESL